MQIFAFLLLIVCVAKTSAVIEWPFSNELYVKAIIGTPGQEIEFTVVVDNPSPGLTTYSNLINAGGFDPNASTTFHKLGDFNPNSDVIGITGTDNFIIKSSHGGAQQLTQKTFNVAAQKANPDPKKTLSLAHSIAGSPNDFLDSVLKDQPKKVVVLTYDAHQGTPIFNSDGKLTLGGSPTFCSNWHMFPEVILQNKYQWGFQLDRIIIGDYILESPGKARFAFDAVAFKFPHSIYNKVLEQLDVTDAGVSCNSTKSIGYVINGLIIEFTVEDYSDKTLFDNDQEQCDFLGYQVDTDEYYEIPMQIFSRYCLMFNYATTQLGLGDKGNEPVWTDRPTQSTVSPTVQPTQQIVQLTTTPYDSGSLAKSTLSFWTLIVITCTIF